MSSMVHKLRVLQGVPTMGFKHQVRPIASRLQADSLPDNIRKAEYAVRGEIVLRSQKIQAELDSGSHNYPFNKLVPCNIGNPQAVGQPPLSFHRQVLSVVTTTEDNRKAISGLPEDVLQRGMEFAATHVGAYSHSKGHPLFRNYVADYIDRRDASPSVPKVDIEDLFITDGASPSVKVAIDLMIHDKDDVILIPIPQYPLYSASVTRAGGTWVGYELGEDYTAEKPAWKLDVSSLESLLSSIEDGSHPDLPDTDKKRVRSIAVINPGNPTGNVLSRQEIEDVCKFAHKHNLVILADEVYQENVYSGKDPKTGKPDPNTPKEFVKEFTSFRKVAHELNLSVQLFSFHSISKGYYGECGLRGGYMHLTNIDQSVNEEIYKLMSMNLCSNTLGQAMVATITNPPKDGSPSAALFKDESEKTFNGLLRKAELVHRKLNEIKGVYCMPIEGAMYAFPEVKLPQKYVDHARDVVGTEPDTLYCIEILEKLGVIVVPGNGFGQRKGTFHYRITCLPEEDELARVLDGLKEFQQELYAKWGMPDGV